MRSIAVEAPDGTAWTVRVAWRPRWRALALRFGAWRRKRRGKGTLDGVDATPAADGVMAIADTHFIGFVVVVAVLLFGSLFWWLLLPLLLVVLDAVVLAVLLVLGVAARVLLRRPWTVEAAPKAGGDPVSVEVVGWRAALRTRDEIAGTLRRGAVI